MENVTDNLQYNVECML